VHAFGSTLDETHEVSESWWVTITIRADSAGMRALADSAGASVQADSVVVEARPVWEVVSAP
jgi:hypothetical protein